MAKKFFTVGNTVRVSVTFTDDADVKVDPTTANFIYRKPGEPTSTTLTYLVDGEVVKTATGRYYVDLTPAADEDGNWRFRWEGVGSNASADEGEFVVEASAV